MGKRRGLRERGEEGVGLSQKREEYWEGVLGIRKGPRLNMKRGQEEGKKVFQGSGRPGRGEKSEGRSFPGGEKKVGVSSRDQSKTGPPWKE